MALAVQIAAELFKKKGKKDCLKIQGEKDDTNITGEKAAEKEWPPLKGHDDKQLNIAIIGSSGVGKSSLINKIFGTKAADLGTNDDAKIKGKRDDAKFKGEKDDSKITGKKDDAKLKRKRDDAKIKGERDDYKIKGEKDGSKTTGRKDDAKLKHDRDDAKIKGEKDDNKMKCGKDDSKIKAQNNDSKINDENDDAQIKDDAKAGLPKNAQPSTVSQYVNEEILWTVDSTCVLQARKEPRLTSRRFEVWNPNTPDRKFPMTITLQPQGASRKEFNFAGGTIQLKCHEGSHDDGALISWQPWIQSFDGAIKHGPRNAVLNDFSVYATSRLQKDEQEWDFPSVARISNKFVVCLKIKVLGRDVAATSKGAASKAPQEQPGSATPMNVQLNCDLPPGLKLPPGLDAPYNVPHHVLELARNWPVSDASGMTGCHIDAMDWPVSDALDLSGCDADVMYVPRLVWEHLPNLTLEQREALAVHEKHNVERYLVDVMQAKTAYDQNLTVQGKSMGKKPAKPCLINKLTMEKVWKGESGALKNCFVCYQVVADLRGGRCGIEEQCHTCKEFENTLTTVMFKNIPNDFSRDDFLSILSEKQITSMHYDFVYLPMDFSRAAGYGYAFVNFTETQHALHAYKEFAGFCDWEANGRVVKSSKKLELTWGDRQGLEDNKKHYSKSPVMHSSRKLEEQPVVFKGGEMYPLETDEKIRKPRTKPKVMSW